MRFYWLNLGIPLLCAVLVLVLFDLTSLDVAISKLFYDPATQVFAANLIPQVEQFTATWARWLTNGVVRLALIGALLSLIWPLIERHPRAVGVLTAIRTAPLLRLAARHRRDLWYVVLAFVLCIGVVQWLKAHTGVYCPIQTTRFGGPHEQTQWFRHMELSGTADEGRCWPGGHAASGFSMLVLYFVALRHQWRYRRWVMWGALLLGLGYGAVRVLQGWHLMSQNLWAGIIVWLVCWLTALAFYGPARLTGRRQA
ncbi:Membrane-associated enzyme, PAP2 (acid phosphatase) superfamily [Pseudomonas sp. ok272]|uniref:phosphatase PAP2 family protein n=1 Tax=unclassified Pseudomonas TaxID=196821 RepID=UPI0008C53847|nr:MULTISPECIES: phosphatase PAP2 family protein [unclassified Pseudomonas]SEN41710.1 Membrane-associated enzyme, PAP2 (acid phosphatase) superfamily [Pseudomonas sp. ok272]SFN26644.1 Membrane-associated enzyme, PAP2 (acid phosphatase) superfamily [Pseudomonas sp. ok602]